MPQDACTHLMLLEEIPCHLNNVIEHKALNQSPRISGGWQGMKVNVSEFGLSIKGSIPKMHFGNNFESLTCSDTYQAFGRIADTFKLGIHKARLSRIDIAFNLSMDYRPDMYYDYMGKARYFSRLVQPQSLYYQNESRAYHLYDKVRQAQKAGEHIPDAFRDKQILRMELRYKKHCSKQLKKPDLQVAHLWEKPFRQQLLTNWKDVYHSIQKIQEMNMDFSGIECPSDLLDQLILAGIKANGGTLGVEKIIKELQGRKAFKHKEYYSREKKKYIQLCKKHQSDQTNDLVAELNTKVNSITV